MTNERVGLWKAVSTTLAGILVTGAAAWLVFGQDKITRDELIEYVSLYTPWQVERGEVIAEIAANAKAIGDLQTIVTHLASQQGNLLTEQRVLVSRVDTLVTELERVRTVRDSK